MDVPELRSAFAFSGTVTEKIRDFRAERIARLLDERTPVLFEKGRKTILHLIPFVSVAGPVRYDFLKFSQQPNRLPPMYWGSSFRCRINLDGIVTFNGGPVASNSYTQLFRNGIIETVGTLMVGETTQGAITYPHASFENELRQHLARMISAQQELGVIPPIAVALSLTGTKGIEMESPFQRLPGIEEDLLVLPETMVEDFSVLPGKVLKPTFDLIWNALGGAQSTNFDEDGNWISR
jgi:hypothetical protein